MKDNEWLGKQVFGNWVVKELIGTGSYGSVFRIEREEFNHVYAAALKVISINTVGEEGENDTSGYTYQHVAELVKEIMMMERLKGNSHIVSYEDHLVTEKEDKKGWDIFIKMEYLTPLNEFIKQAGLTVAEVIKLGIHICSALELCSNTQIIHRDIKPQNIFVSPYGDMKLGDFGIAKQLERDIMVQSKQGTFVYMAPEVYMGKPYDETADIYSLGLVLYRLLNDNRMPFLPYYPEAVTYENQKRALEDRISGLPIPPPRIAIEQLTKIIFKACAFESENRYKSAEEMREDLEKIDTEALKSFRLTAGNMDVNETGSSRLFGAEASFAIVNSLPEDESTRQAHAVWGVRKSLRQETVPEEKRQTSKQTKKQDVLFGEAEQENHHGAVGVRKQDSLLDSKINHIENNTSKILKDSSFWDALDCRFKWIYKLSTRKGKQLSPVEVFLILFIIICVLVDFMVMGS